MKKLYFVTGNPQKLREASQILTDFKILNKKINLPELQGEPKDIVREKAAIAYKKLKKPVFVEDVSLCFDALNGLPGPYVNDFLKKITNSGLIKLLAPYRNRKATVKCMIGYAQSSKNIKVFSGEVKGTITKRAKGKGCFGIFGFDPIFIPKASKKTFAQMTHEEKNKISHRKKALMKFRKYLRG